VTEPLAPKQAPPSLDARAPRPRAVRLRRSAVSVIVLGAAALLSGSLAWAFIVKPEMRAEARDRPREARDPAAPGTVRAGDVITDQPATYDRLAATEEPLPEPRVFGEPDELRQGAEDLGAPPPARYARVSEPSYAPPTHHPLAARSDPRAHGGPVADAAGSGLFFSGSAGASAARETERTAAPALRQDYAAVYGGHALLAPLSPYELKAGAFIPGALVTAVDTSRPGPVVAAVTQNVFDTVTGRILLVPQGTKLIGRHGGESRYGDKRAFLIWDRLILPNGKSLILTEEAGVDAQGAVGIRGRADRRLLQLGASALFAGAISTLGELARSGADDDRSLLGSVGDAASIEAAQVGGRLIDRELDVRPSIHVRAGSPVRVLVTRDLILEPYRP
jgi:type IV secretion system protein VirB10